MNAKLYRAAIPLMATGMLICPAIALSMEFPYIFSDPLHAVPAVIQKGVILPGDSTPIPRLVQKDFSQPLTLAEAVDLALSNNPKIKGAWAEIKVQSGILGQVKAAYLPSINGSANWTYDDLNYPNESSSTTRYTGQASVNWRLFDFGGRSANLSAAENQLATALASYDATLQESLAEVIQGYFDTITAAAALKAKTEDEGIAKSTLQSAKDREAKGTTSRSDTLRATTALAKATLDKNRATGDYQKALAVLTRYLGLPGNTQLLIPSDMQEHRKGALETRELALWLEDAQKNHPAIVAARKSLEATKDGVIVTRSAGLPTVNLSGNYYNNTRQGVAATQKSAQETTVMLSLNIPLFDGFASTYKLRGAQADVEKEAATLADTEQKIAMGIIRAFAETTSSLRNLEASATLLESAQSALASSQRRYDKGAADIIELLSTQAALADAWHERIRCLAEWNSARLQLLANSGKMGRFAVTDSAAD